MAPQTNNVVIKNAVGRWLGGQVDTGMLNLIHAYSNIPSQQCFGLQATCHDIDVASKSCLDGKTGALHQTPVLGVFNGSTVAQICNTRLQN